ncbi:MAG: hypothetical protein JJE04_16310 [Acidobacteriia bacterium]|nr:hypothetical protein [Terriglobia bacterium]
MSFNYLPLLVVWIALAVVVLALFVWRQTLARNEDDALHVLQGALAPQAALALKLDAIDKWGKILTVLTVVFGLLLAAGYVFGQLIGRSGV